MVKSVLGLVFFIILFIFFVRILERKSLFYPAHKIEVSPAELGLEYKDVFLKTSDGIRLHGWFLPAEDASATVLHFHGNAGNISHRLDIAGLFNQKNMNFFIFDYRGFGKSSGTPSEKGTYLDAMAAYSYLVDAKAVLPERIVLHGESLGAAVAIDLAVKIKAVALICESGFTSVRDMAKEIYKHIPLWIFASRSYDSFAKIRQVNIPVLVIHSRDDEIVPFSQGRRLFERANEPKEFYAREGGHNDGLYLYGEENIQVIDGFLRKHLK